MPLIDDEAYQKAIDRFEAHIMETRMRKAALYARVSTEDKDQNPETQLHAMREYCANAGWEICQEYVDYARAKDYKRRKAWAQLLKDARQRKFQVLVVFKLDRISRETVYTLNVLRDLDDRNINFISITQDFLDTTTSAGRFVLPIFAAIAELESAQIGDRVRAGMARAKAQGNSLGRKSYAIPFTKVCKAVREASRGDGQPNFTEAAKILSKEFGYRISPAFVYMRIKRTASARGITRDQQLEEIIRNDQEG